MKTQRRSISEMVDIELRELKRRYKNGKENPNLYKFKIKNLNLIKETANIGSKEWKETRDR